MTTRYSPLYANFIEWDDPLNALVTASDHVTAVLSLFESAEVIKKWGQITRGRATFRKQPYWDELAVEGRIVSLYQHNAILNAGFVFPFREMGAFLVQKVKEGVDRDGRETVEMSGMGMEHLLTKYRHWAPIGEETIYSTTLAATAIGPTATTLAVGAPHGNKSCTVVSTDGFDVGDEIRLEMGTPSGSDGIHVSRLTGIEEPGWNENQVTFLDRMPYDAPATNDVEVRTAKLRLTSVTGMAVGMRVRITLDSAAVHETLIIKVEGADREVIIRDGLPSPAASGKAVVAYDYSEPATDDVTQIIAPAAADGWAIEFDSGSYDGTATGTTHAPAGDSAWDLLSATAQQTGEFFRIQYLGDGHLPRKLLKWQRAHVDSSITLWNYADTASVAVKTEDVNSGIIYDLYRERESDIITRLYPVASDGRISFAYCSEEALADAATAGFTVVISTDLYQPDYIEHNAGVTAHGVLEETVRYGNITLSKEGSVTELQSASNAMLLQSMTTLNESQNRTYWRCRAQIHRPVFPGQYLTINNQGTPLGAGSEPPNYTTLYILEVRETYSASDKGVIMTSLLLSEEPFIQPSAVQSLGGHLRATNQAARRQQTVETRTATYKIETGGTGSGVYLPLAGGTMTGSIGLGSGLTVDGVDISAHAANASAHHAPVTVVAPIALSGQQVSLAINADAGLYDSSGLKIKLATHSGLALGSNELKVGTPTTLTAATTNQVAGNTHAHAVTWTAEGYNTTSTLLGVNASGYMSAKKIAAGIGVSALSNAALFSYPSATTDKALHLRARSGQSASLLEVTSSTDTTWLKVTPDGNLESGDPGFVSGRTGWQISRYGKAEFNDVFVRGELHAVVFTADEVNAAGGSLMVATSSTVAPQVGGSDNVLPAVGSSFTLNATASWVTGYNYFPVGSVIRIKTIKVGSGIDVYDIYAEVTAVGSQAGRVTSPAAGQRASAGYYPLTCTLRWGGAVGYQIPDGSAMVLWTEAQTTPSGYTGNIHITSSGNYTPYIDVSTLAHIAKTTWVATPTTTPRVRLGNLDGVLGLPEQWGIAMGTDLSSSATSARYIVASDLQLSLHNVDLDIYSGASQTVSISNTGNVKFGTNVSSGATTTFSFVASDGTLRIGPSSGPYVYWGGDGLYMRNSSGATVIQLDSSGNSTFQGAMNIGTGGGIWQGTGSFGSPTTGLKIWNDSGVGRLATYNAGTAQVYFDTTGALVAGGGLVTMDASGFHALKTATATQAVHMRGTGIEFEATTTVDASRGLNWISGGNTFARISGYSASGGKLQIYNSNPSATGSHEAVIDLFVENLTAAKTAGLYIKSGSTSEDAKVLVTGPLTTDKGISVGAYFTPNVGQVVTDLTGSAWNSVVLLDTARVDHGMTAIVNTSTYGALGKNGTMIGGLAVSGLTESGTAINLQGYATTVDTTEATSSYAAIQASAYKKSGTGTTTLGNDDNLFAVSNNASTQFIVKGDGQIFSNGAHSTYDDFADAELVRAVTLARNPAGLIRSKFDEWVRYNRDDLEQLGLLSTGGFINVTGMQALHSGAIWELHKRLSKLEERLT